MAYVYNSQLDAFTLYHKTAEDAHEQRAAAVGPALPALGHALSGSVGTAVSKLITYPLDIVITRLQVQKQLPATATHADYRGILDAVERIYRDEGGISAFYNGVVPETLKGVADSFLFFLAYTYIGQKRRAALATPRLSARDEIFVGMLAGAFSKFFTSPIQNVVTRMQTAAMVTPSSPSTVKDVALRIHREQGLTGFWAGYSASLVLTVNPSVTFLLHKLLLRLLVPSGRRSDPGARVTFLLAAISKALASIITYPFSLAKTRAQVASKPAAAKSTSTTARPVPRDVFRTILQTAMTDGVGALYQGLGAEVLKGFFSHGITMLMKDRLHGAIINLYYILLHTLKKYPSPEELAKMASERAHDAFDKGKERLEDALEHGKGQLKQRVRERQPQAVLAGKTVED